MINVLLYSRNTFNFITIVSNVFNIFKNCNVVHMLEHDPLIYSRYMLYLCIYLFNRLVSLSWLTNTLHNHLETVNSHRVFS